MKIEDKEISDERIKKLELAVKDFIREHDERKAIQPTWNDKHIQKFKEIIEES